MKNQSTLFLGAIFITCCFIFFAYATTTLLSGTFGIAHSPGIFLTGGNAGTITLMDATQELATRKSGIYYDSVTNTLTGNLFLQTAGWVHLGESGHDIEVEVPSGIGLPLALTGIAWSENAGWIVLGSESPSTYSGVYYLPSVGTFTGIAWSKTLGYIDFAGINGLIGRVKIIGNVGSSNIYDAFSLSSNGVIRANTVLTPFINKIRKNASLLTRNLPNDKINKVPGTNNSFKELMYYKLPGGGLVYLSSATTFCSTETGPRSIIVDGGDIVIDRDVSGISKSCAIIALSNGVTGGDIYITDAPKTIESYIVAEKSVYSGEDGGNLYNDTPAKLISLPQNQLYVRGGVITRNTIGGASTLTGACPFTETACDVDTAIKYDLNFFRNFSRNPLNRGYKDDSLDNYSFIIEYDSRLPRNPPPGFE